jgi:NAD(P)-dependent dehydrogenase (short-subunit alcohol dehydrogenase family)
MNPFDLTGKVALVTGSSRGIGRSVAEHLAAAGARVVISSRRQEACDAVAQAINDCEGREAAIAIAASISSKSALEELVQATQTRLGLIDILVCNAASNPYYGPLLNISDEMFRKIFDNNVLSNHWLITMVAPGMIERRSGSIIIMSSLGAYLGHDAVGSYNISKAADLQLVRNLAVELGPQNIRVNALAPGVIKTDFAKPLYEDEAAAAKLLARTPLRRLGEPADVAGAALFLASPASSHITGQSFVIDGGLSINGT